MMILGKLKARRIRKLFHGFVTLVSSASIVVSSVSASFAQTIIVDPSAPGTSFLQSGNGTSQLNIKTPESGVSLNKLSDFSVSANGLILNNSTSNGVSVIGENVTANPNLMVSGPADTIVAEVTGSAPSTMTGTTEVFGKKAAVIIANPNGIICNGCAFLNSASSTLTTGKPIVSGDKVDLAVTKGTITIGAGGFDPGSQGAVIGRHVIMDGPVVTSAQGAENDLLISGGAQRVQGLNGADLSASTIVAAPSTTAKTSPFSIDASENGVLRGGNVIVRSPEAGQGINLYGAVEGLSLTASSGGNLFYKDIDVDTSVSLTGSELRQYGQVSSGGDVSIQGRAFTLYDGRVIETAGDISITGEEFVVIAGEVSGHNISIDVTTGTLTNTGFIMADGALTVIAGENVAQQRQVAREYDIYLDPALQQYIQAYYDQLALGGSEADLAAEMIARASRHELVAEYIEKGATTTGETVVLLAEGEISNEGGAIAGTRDVRLTAGANIINTFLALKSRLDADDGCSGENCGYRTDFHAGEILAGRDLVLAAGEDVLNEASDIAAKRDLTVFAGQDVNISLSNSDYTATGARIDEEIVLAPSRVMTLHGNLGISAGRDLVLAGSILSAGGDISLDAGEKVELTAYTGKESDFRIENERIRSCYDYDYGYYYCAWVNHQTTIADGTVLATASPNLVGRSIRIAAEDDLILEGAKLFSANGLSLSSTSGSVSANSVELPDGIDLENGADQQLASSLVGAIHGIWGSVNPSTPEANNRAFLDFLKDNELLTSVEALSRAESGAQIKDAARAVGVQSYVSLADNTRLDTLRKEADAELNEIWHQTAADLDAHDEEVASLHKVFRAEIAELEDRLADVRAEQKPDLDKALSLVTHTYNAEIEKAEAGYQSALKATEEKFAGRLTKTIWRVRWVGAGADRRRERYSIESPNNRNIRLKKVYEDRALAEFEAAKNVAASARILNEAFVRASFSDNGLGAEIDELSRTFHAQLNDFADRKTTLVNAFNGKLGETMRRAAALLEQEAESDAMRGDAVARGSVVEGEKSLAISLTRDAFPNLAVTNSVTQTGSGILEGQWNEGTQRTRLVTKTREVGEFQDVQTTRREARYSYGCDGRPEDGNCNYYRTYVDVPTTETHWVVTGTEEYLAKESYLDGAASSSALISEDKTVQDAFMSSTAWRMDTGANQNTGSEAPRNKLVANAGNLVLEAGSELLVENADISAKGQFNTTSMGDTNLRSTDITAYDFRMVAGGIVSAEAANISAEGDASIFGAAGVTISPRAWHYNVSDTQMSIKGALASKDWGITHGQSLVSQELAKVLVGGDLNINTTGNLYIAGTEVSVGNDLILSASGDLQLTAQHSTINYSDGDDRNGQDLAILRPHVNALEVGGTVKTRSVGATELVGTRINTPGDIDIASGGDLVLNTALNVRDYSYRTYRRSWFRTRSYKLSERKVTNHGVELSSDGDITLESTSGDVKTAGSQLESRSGNVNISATNGEIYAGSYTDFDRHESRRHRSSFFGLFSSTSNSLTETGIATGTGALAAANLTLVSGGDTTLVGAQLAAGGDLNLNVGGNLNIEAAINQERRDFFESNVGLILATTETERSNRETAVLTSLNADGDINFSVGGQTYLTLYNSPDEDSPSVGELYPDELSALAGLVLQDQELLDEYFYDQTKALSPAFTMVLSIALTQGFGNLFTNAGIKGLTTVVQGTNASGLATTTVKLTKVGKAVASFAASTTVGIANGTVSGDLDLGQILKSAAISAGTSYLQSAINLKASGDDLGAASAKAAGQAAKESAKTFGNGSFNILGDSKWTGNLDKSLFKFGKELTLGNVFEAGLDAAIGAGIQNAAYGTDFGDTLKGSFIRSVVSLGLADVQMGIGEIFSEGKNGGEGSFGHVMLHGIAGCAVAEAQGADCAAGAAGAIAQAVYAGRLGDNSKLTMKQERQQAQLIGAAAGWLLSGGEANNVSAAGEIALSGISNNRQLHSTEIEALKAHAKKLAETGAAGADGPMSEKEWLRALTLEAMRQVDKNYSDQIPENEVALEQLSVLIASHGETFKHELGGTLKFLNEQGTPHFDNYLLNAQEIAKNREFYDEVLSDWTPENLDGLQDHLSATDRLLLNLGSFGAARSSKGFLLPAELAPEDWSDTELQAYRDLQLYSLTKETTFAYKNLMEIDRSDLWELGENAAIARFNLERNGRLNINDGVHIITEKLRVGAIRGAYNSALSGAYALLQLSADTVHEAVPGLPGHEAAKARNAERVKSLVWILSNFRKLPNEVQDHFKQIGVSAENAINEGNFEAVGEILGELQGDAYLSLAVPGSMAAKYGAKLQKLAPNRTSAWEGVDTTSRGIGADVPDDIAGWVKGPDGSSIPIQKTKNGQPDWKRFLQDNAEVTNISGNVDAGSVRFTQSSISGNFSDGRSVDDLVTGLRNGTIDPASLPPIRTFEVNGQLYSLDNRRL